MFSHSTVAAPFSEPLRIGAEQLAVRKLLVNIFTTERPNLDTLRAHFQRFGTIQSIEVSFGSNALTAASGPRAPLEIDSIGFYITYTKSISASRLLFASGTDRYLNGIPLSVQPANSCLQPDYTPDYLSNLIGDCLQPILSHLHVFDLLNLSQMNQRLCAAANEAIAKRQLDYFTERLFHHRWVIFDGSHGPCADSVNVLKRVGRNLVRLELNLPGRPHSGRVNKDWLELLLDCMYYCTPGQLLSLAIGYLCFDGFLIDPYFPLFQNLTKLTLEAVECDDLQLTQVMFSARHLRFLELSRMQQLTGTFLVSKANRLHSIKLNECTIVAERLQVEFLKQNRHLLALKMHRSNGICYKNFCHMARYCENLEVLDFCINSVTNYYADRQDRKDRVDRVERLKRRTSTSVGPTVRRLSRQSHYTGPESLHLNESKNHARNLDIPFLCVHHLDHLGNLPRLQHLRLELNELWCQLPLSSLLLRLSYRNVLQHLHITYTVLNATILLALVNLRSLRTLELNQIVMNEPLDQRSWLHMASALDNLTHFGFSLREECQFQSIWIVDFVRAAPQIHTLAIELITVQLFRQLIDIRRRRKCLQVIVAYQTRSDIFRKCEKLSEESDGAVTIARK